MIASAKSHPPNILPNLGFGIITWTIDMPHSASTNHKKGENNGYKKSGSSEHLLLFVISFGGGDKQRGISGSLLLGFALTGVEIKYAFAQAEKFWSHLD